MLRTLERTLTEREKLRREINVLGQMIEANAMTLASKTMSLDDREALKRQMAIRIGHQKLLQQRLNRLFQSQMIDRPRIRAEEQPLLRVGIECVSAAVGTPRSGGSF